ncbi:MAG: type II toxin-antitoxin system HicA family toxin [bacterium]|nr:type II toxin-antitoxin system HicA family toxin [bacterium]
MKSLTAKQVINILQKYGFSLSRQRGSHMIFHNKTTGKSVPVPLHGKTKPLPIGTFLAIIKQSDIPKEKFNRR